MPYTKPERRQVVDSFKGEYGDLVYFYYKILQEAWLFQGSFSRWFQMRHFITAGLLEHVDGDLRHALLDEEENFKVPECLENVRYAAPFAYESAVDEIKRRYVDKYEDLKIKENGDVE